MGGLREQQVSSVGAPDRGGGGVVCTQASREEINLSPGAQRREKRTRADIATCINHFPDPIKELTTVCPGLTVMEHPKGNTSPDGAEVYRLYYGFDFDDGKNFWAIATVDIQPHDYGFEIVSVYRVGFRMVEKASAGDQARYELERASGLYAYNKDLFKQNKELRGAIGKKPLKPSKKAYEVLMHEAQARV